MTDFEASALQLLVDLHGFSVTDLSCYPVMVRSPRELFVVIWRAGVWEIYRRGHSMNERPDIWSTAEIAKKSW